MILVDPPEGWRYGFPKELPEPPPEDLNAWLISKGYPSKLIEAYKDFFYVRYINVGDE
jgi:hypothetical protein